MSVKVPYVKFIVSIRRLHSPISHEQKALKFLTPNDNVPPVPWHRVISSAGTISSRGPGTSGAAQQQQALVAEGVQVVTSRTGDMKVDFTRWGWFPTTVGDDDEDDDDDNHNYNDNHGGA
jgi:methylated-DNA-protein-cysteine methyltransferase-like protein